MTYRILIVLAMVGFVSTDGRSDGRRGNEAFAEGDFRAAAEAYQQGLAAAAEEGDARLAFGLTNNLGAARYRLDDAAKALEAFTEAAARAPNPEARATANYNAGNAAFKAQDLQRALAHYQRALLADPDDQDAKFNYEFVKRKLQEQSEQQQQQQQQQGGEQQQQQQEGENPQQNEGEKENEGEGQDQQEPQPQEGESPEDEQSEGSESRPPEETADDEPRQPGDAPQDTREMSREQAERILQALESEEAELLREVQRMDARPRSVEKDW